MALRPEGRTTHQTVVDAVLVAEVVDIDGNFQYLILKPYDAVVIRQVVSHIFHYPVNFFLTNEGKL